MTKKRKRKSWINNASKEDINEFIHLFESGLGTRKIAQKLNINRGTVQKIIKELKLFKKNIYIYKDYSIQESQQNKMCFKCGDFKSLKEFYTYIPTHRKPEKLRIHKNICIKCDKTEKSRRHAKHSKKLGKRIYTEITETDLSNVKILFEQEYKTKEIANQLNTNTTRIYNIYKILGIRARRNLTKEQKLANQRAKWKNNPIYRLQKSISLLVRLALKAKNSSKSGQSIFNFLSYTVLDLKQTIENKFEYWMTWNNQGKYDPKIWDDNDPITWKWQLDHIIPQSNLLYTSMEDENFKKCWSLENLRPLSAKQNLLDGVRRIRHSDLNSNNITLK